MSFDWKTITHPSGLHASEEAVRQFEQELGFDLPTDYVIFLLSINGGRITCQHDIPVYDLSMTVYLQYLYPLSSMAPFVGVREGRRTQVAARVCRRQMVEIGGDAGTGFFFLMLAGRTKGSIYYILKDNLAPVSEGVWFAPKVTIPDGMVTISKSFDKLGEVIWATRSGGHRGRN